MYHAQSFAQVGWTVYLIGFAGKTYSTYPFALIADLDHHDLRNTCPGIAPKLTDSNGRKCMGTAQMARKTPSDSLHISRPAQAHLWCCKSALVLACRPTLIPSSSTPPALPTLPIVQIASLIQGSKLVIDWHNTAYSVLALRLGQRSIFTRFAKNLEGLFGRRAAAHFFVSDIMKQTLSGSWSLSGTKVVFHDKPQDSSKRLSTSEAHHLFLRLSDLFQISFGDFLPSSNGQEETHFTTSLSGGEFERRADRSALLVSSTSWTADEDFSVLLDALGIYEQAANQPNAKLPKVAVLITGKGANKASFELSAGRLRKTWRYVRCSTAWLESDIYPKLLGAADLGISLHSSSSGLDLPMKVVDMFGAGLPVLALDFAWSWWKTELMDNFL
ncbi:MAG: mannosyltransferase [Cyphobasidiales sp. Tagirdzhanova-0007]|nr:MAG: mannosyltransferase [Cyphobasidiales sp. Tagirdzhanova-0007]